MDSAHPSFVGTIEGPSDPISSLKRGVRVKFGSFIANINIINGFQYFCSFSLGPKDTGGDWTERRGNRDLAGWFENPDHHTFWFVVADHTNSPVRAWGDQNAAIDSGHDIK